MLGEPPAGNSASGIQVRTRGEPAIRTSVGSHVITGAGHCANLDRPDQVNALVGTFLARHLTD
jgi:pimeloyl-ACP methyl ester carboxylesterase